MYEFEIEIEGLPPINSADAMHWRTRDKHRSTWKRLVWVHTRKHKRPEPLKRARVTITRHSSVEPDPANLGEGAKFLLDGLVEAGIIRDDDRACIGFPVLRWKSAPPKAGKVTVEVRELDESSEAPREIIHVSPYEGDAKTLHRLAFELGAQLHVQGGGFYLEPYEVSVIYRAITGQMLTVESLDDVPGLDSDEP